MPYFCKLAKIPHTIFRIPIFWLNIEYIGIPLQKPQNGHPSIFQRGLDPQNDQIYPKMTKFTKKRPKKAQNPQKSLKTGQIGPFSAFWTFWPQNGSPKVPLLGTPLRTRFTPLSCQNFRKHQIWPQNLYQIQLKSGFAFCRYCRNPPYPDPFAPRFTQGSLHFHTNSPYSALKVPNN